MSDDAHLAPRQNIAKHNQANCDEKSDNNHHEGGDPASSTSRALTIIPFAKKSVLYAEAKFV